MKLVIMPRGLTGKPSAYRWETSPKPMQRGTAHSWERSSNKIVVTELGGIQKPDQTKANGSSNR
ncbi:hypothetical protein [Paenibacillus peoriae]|uniref:hypothetical protein n=1 Tax=Paenibacillus peoriae TaxID=59893 RepID=UPI00208EF0A1|nr:hypothetical protein [Paenibacillus peoriae]